MRSKQHREKIMPLLSRLFSLWCNLFHKARKEEELTEEIDAYLEILIEQKIEEGLALEEARRAALIELGGRQQVKEKVWEVSVGNQLVTFWQDLRYGLRMLGRNPGLTAVAVLSLALGIGANTAIFSLLDAVLLRMLPVKNPKQLVILERDGAPVDKGSRHLSSNFYERLRGQIGLLDGFCTFWRNDFQVVVDGQAESFKGDLVSGSFFSVLGVNALLGRTIAEEDNHVPGGQPVVVISYNFWRRRFASDPEILGRRIVLNGQPHTIIGVTPPNFFGVSVGQAPPLWKPIGKDQVGEVMARLRPEVSEQQASTVLTGLLQQSLAVEDNSGMSLAYRQSVPWQRVVLIPASQGISSLRAQFSEPLRILMAVVGLVLLIACANVANLLLARATARRKEIAVRLALGAGRLRLIRQLLTESILLALSGGVLGLVFAWWGSRFLLALVGSGRNPVFLNLTPDARMLAFTAAASLLAGILFGLAPAWRATRVDLTPALKDNARISRGGARLGLGKMLVVMQVALSLLLLIGAGLFVRSLEKLKSIDAGFNRENVLLISTDPQMIGYQEGARQIVDLYQRMLERIKAIPGVRSVSLSGEGLLSGIGATSGGRLHVRRQPSRNVISEMSAVGPEYFETVGMTILRGRGFTAQDHEKEPHVAVVNETFARHYFGGDNELGHRISFAPGESEVEIVGVVKDAKYDNLREPPTPIYYVPYVQNPHFWRGTTFHIRTAADPTRIIAAVRQAVREIDANLPLFNIKTLATQIDETIVQERLIGTVSSFFGLLSLLLAAIGLYGVLAYAVNQRTHEIGIRMALGAQRGEVLLMVLRQGMKLVLIGVVLGLAASFAATRLVASYLFGITATDPVTFIGVPILLLMVAFLACFVPARRATRVDPLVALRYE
jgi:predicted permease